MKTRKQKLDELKSIVRNGVPKEPKYWVLLHSDGVISCNDPGWPNKFQPQDKIINMICGEKIDMPNKGMVVTVQDTDDADAIENFYTDDN